MKERTWAFPKLNGIVTSGTVDPLLISLFPDFIHYIIAFVLLASFWWASHLRSHYLQSIDKKMSFLTITTLLFVGLIPFSTNLAGDFPLNSHAVIIFELNLLAIGILSVWQWNQILNDTAIRDPMLISGCCTWTGMKRIFSRYYPFLQSFSQ